LRFDVAGGGQNPNSRNVLKRCRLAENALFDQLAVGLCQALAQHLNQLERERIVPEGGYERVPGDDHHKAVFQGAHGGRAGLVADHARLAKDRALLQHGQANLLVAHLAQDLHLALGHDE